MYNDYQDSNEQYNNDYNNYNYSQYNPTGSNVLRNKALPITLTWNANAWVKNKLSLKEKIMSRFSSDDDDDAEFKQILTNGKQKFKGAALNFFF